MTAMEQKEWLRLTTEPIPILQSKNGDSYINIKGSGNLKKNHFDFIGWELAETNVNQAGSKIYQAGVTVCLWVMFGRI